MRPAFLYLDESIAEQTRLLASGSKLAARTLDARHLGPALRLWSRPAALSKLADILSTIPCAPGSPDLFFFGSGDFHHVSQLLIARAASVEHKPITVLHFDNHPDWVQFQNGLHCGSWAARAARLDGVRRFISVGICSKDILLPGLKSADLSVVRDGKLELYPYTTRSTAGALELCGRKWPSIEILGESRFCDFLSSRINPDSNVYITIDKDVLRPADAVTNWDQGQLSLGFLLRILTKIVAKHRIVGADICGDWSRPAFGGGLAQRFLKAAEAAVDRPNKPFRTDTHEINEAANIRLLTFFASNA